MIMKIIKSPETISFDEEDGREMESVISIDDIEIKINAKESFSGSNFIFKNVKENKIIKELNHWSFDENEYVEVENEIYDILEKLGYATLYDQLGNEGEEFNSEEILTWEF